jgi:hypothetical protein
VQHGRPWNWCHAPQRRVSEHHICASNTYANTQSYTSANPSTNPHSDTDTNSNTNPQSDANANSNTNTCAYPVANTTSTSGYFLLFCVAH